MSPGQNKRLKVSATSATPASSLASEESSEIKEGGEVFDGKQPEEESTINNNSSTDSNGNIDTYGLEAGDLTDDTDSEEDDDDDVDGDSLRLSGDIGNHIDIQEQLAAAGPAGVAAAAAIATARKRKRPHSFETNPSVRKRQQTRLIRKLRACIDEYTMRVGQQAVVLITMPGKQLHNFKVFGAQPLESVIRTCKHEIMAELDQALAEQAPIKSKENNNKHELPPLVIDGIPTPVEKMTQAQLRAFIPLMLKYSTGRGKPGWGKDSTRPPWWPETLPWANVRSDARDESEKQRISWTTTLRQIVTNCYSYHGRDDLLPTFDENEEATKQNEQNEQNNSTAAALKRASSISGTQVGSRSLGSSTSNTTTSATTTRQQHQQVKDQLDGLNVNNQQSTIYSSSTAYASNFVHTITNADGTVSLIQVDPANAQILTLPDGTQVRAVRLQTLAGETFAGQQLSEIHDPSGSIELSAIETMPDGSQAQAGATTVSVSEASLGADGQIIVTGEDGTQSCYPMSSLVSIPASVYQQFAQGGGQQLSIISADGTSIPANAISIHSIQDTGHHQIGHQETMNSQDEEQPTGVSQEETSVGLQQKQELKAEQRNGNTNNANNSNSNDQNGT